MDRLTVICVLRSGGCYNGAYVHRLEQAVARHLSIPHDFVCLTDRPVPCESIPMRHAFSGKWSKVELFDPALPLSGRILYLDLDVVIQGNIDAIAETPGDFAICWSGRQKPHLRRVPGYNSSIMVWDAGARPQIFNRFTPEVMDRLIGDQDWIGEVCPGERTIDDRLYQKHREGMEPIAPAVLCNRPKPHEMPARGFIRRHWMAA